MCVCVCVCVLVCVCVCACFAKHKKTPTLSLSPREVCCANQELRCTIMIMANSYLLVIPYTDIPLAYQHI